MAKTAIAGVESLFSTLIAAGHTPELTLKNRKELSIVEQGKKYRLKMAASCPSGSFGIDGKIVKVGLRCDKLVLVNYGAPLPVWAEVFVELKGTDVMRAVDQLRATITKPMFCHITNKKVLARIVASSYPSNNSNPAMEKAKIEFKKRYSCELRTLKSEQFDNLS